MEKQRIIDCGCSDIDSLSRTLLKPSSPSRSLPISADAVAVGVNYILHPVSKFDTLAGVAIKYGIEVTEIKKLNGLVTDLQMYALKELKVPLPGVEPPASILSNDHHVTLTRPNSSGRSDVVDSFQSPGLKYSSDSEVSPATTSFQGFYRLVGPVYQNNGVAHDQENERSPAFSSLPKPPLHRPRKSKSVAHGLESVNPDLLDPLLSHENENVSPDKWVDKFLRRRPRSEGDFTSRYWEKLLKEGSSNSASAITCNRLAILPKSAG